MKWFHLSDLHLGKRIRSFSMLEEQRWILKQILGQVRIEHPDAVLIAGDVYDKPVPPAEAVRLFDAFLYELSALHCPVLVISGNHDSPERIAFGGRLMEGSGIHLSPVYDGTVKPVVLEDQHGPVDFYLLPFIRPAQVRCIYEEEVTSYTDAMRVAISHFGAGRSGVDPLRRNVLVCHQFVTGGIRSESEELFIGGLDHVDVSVFAPFDYVALGHLHRPQNLDGGRIRYCGTPLKYSFSEAHQEKSITVVELEQKGNRSVRTIPLSPLHDMEEWRGSYEALIMAPASGSCGTDSYLHITLTDETIIPDAAARLQLLYPRLMKLDYDNQMTRKQQELQEPEPAAQQDPMELLEKFYQMQNNHEMHPAQKELVRRLMKEIREEQQ